MSNGIAGRGRATALLAAPATLPARPCCDRLGDGAVPVGRGRAAELFAVRRDCGCALQPVLTSGGVALSYSLIGRTLITATARGRQHGLHVRAERDDGSWTFTLVDQLDHARGQRTENDLTIQLGAIVQATDRDGDTVTASRRPGDHGRRRHADCGCRDVDRDG